MDSYKEFLDNQQKFLKGIENVYGQQVPCNREGIDKAVKETLSKMLAEYDSLDGNQLATEYSKLTQLLMGRMMFPK